jgi:CRP-like cAMP-binding protein
MLDNQNFKWQPKMFDRGNIIPTESNILWLINQGVVKTSTYDEKNNSIILGYWGKGDLVGKSLSRIKAYKIECLTHVELACVPYQYWNQLAQKIRCHHHDTEEILYIFRQKNLYERTIKILTFLAKKFGIEHKQGRLIQLPLTHHELADFIGATRVSVTRIINRLEREELIARPDRGYIILRPDLMNGSAAPKSDCFNLSGQKKLNL